MKDSSFNVDELHHYNLLIQIGVRDIQVSVVDSLTSKIMLLEDYVLARVDTHKAHRELLEALFESHHFLMAGFWKEVRISVKNKKFALVPASLFVEDAAWDYIKLNARVNPDSEIALHYIHEKADIASVFSMSKTLFDWFGSLYPNAKVSFIHQSSTLIEGALNASRHNNGDGFYIYIDRFKLHIITVKDGRLEYYNQFTIRQFDEYVKYIMMVMKATDRSQQRTLVTLWGYIGQKSPHYNEFRKFIKNITLGDRSAFLNYGYVFDELQDHHFFDLYSMHLCA